MDKNQKIIVVKVGTSTLTHSTGMLNIRKIEHLCRVLCDIENSGVSIILVSSGAVSAGWVKMGLAKRPDTISEMQAAAAIGQCELMSMYDKYIIGYGYVVAQILLTKEDVEDSLRRENAQNTFRLLLERRSIPIVNENDSVSFEGIKIGGNDILSAYVASLVKADLLINLSDVDGFYDADPKNNPDARLIPVVRRIDAALESIAGGAGTSRGTGGMRAKLKAAKIANEAGVPMVIANGSNPDILYDICSGKQIGTLFLPEKATD
jgi:glutamate 5-kinase